MAGVTEALIIVTPFEVGTERLLHPTFDNVLSI